MYINSGKTGMESERSYYKFSTFRKGEVLEEQSMKEDGTGTLFGDLLSGSKENFIEQKEEKDASGELSDIVADMRARIHSFVANGTNASPVSRDWYSQIQEYCLLHILKLLFPEKYKEYADRQGLMGINQSNGAAYGLSTGMFGAGTVRQTTTEYYYEEAERTEFRGEGKVVCDDGREISFNLCAKMSRSFAEYYREVEQQNYTMLDPLVINLHGNVTEISDQYFYFDLDSDGVEDKISKLVEDSGFLVYDKNEDGIINDGSELFGTKTGNGFKELEQYDDDKDGFIDEHDAIFSKLKIWTMDAFGKSHYISLKEANIGAIGLNNAATDFDLNDEDNTRKAQIRRSGIFLFEDGQAGLIQQVDMAKIPS